MDRQWLHLRIDGMHCAEEVALLKKHVGPLVGGDNFLHFDLLNQKMSVHLPDDVSHASIKEAVVKSGMQAALFDTPQTGLTFWERKGRVVMTALSGGLILLGVLLHFLFNHTFFGVEGNNLLPPVVLCFLLAIVTGAYHVLPKALAALRAFQPDMNLLMLVAVLGAIFIGEWFEAASVTFLFSVSVTLEAWSIGRARRAITGLMQLSPLVARLFEQGVEKEVPPHSVPVGGRIIVKAGEMIPLDGTVVHGNSDVNQAPITGESRLVAKTEGDAVFAGTINGDGVLEMISTKPASDTTLANILRVVGESQAKRSKSEQWVERFAKVYTPCVMGLALLVFLVPLVFFHEPWTGSLYRALVMLVIACPCALVIATPVSIVCALTSAARAGVLVKGGRYLEAAASIQAVAFDKTGTLTEGKPEVKGLVCLSGHTEDELLERALALESRSEHPLAQAIVAFAEQRGVRAEPAQHFQILKGKGAVALFKGKPFWIGSHRFAQERGQDAGALQSDLEALARDGSTVVVIGNEAHICGYFALSDGQRQEAPESLAALKRLGVKHIVMLTGDNKETAEKIAKETGVDAYFAEMLPEDKMAKIEELAAKFGTVAMVGDGVNDAPAMAKSTLAIAMGVAGSDVAIETADIALMADDLLRLPWIFQHARQTLSILRFNIGFALVVKALVMLCAILGVASLWGAIAADTGSTLCVVANSLRLLKGQLTVKRHGERRSHSR